MMARSKKIDWFTHDYALRIQAYMDREIEQWGFSDPAALAETVQRAADPDDQVEPRVFFELAEGCLAGPKGSFERWEVLVYHQILKRGCSRRTPGVKEGSKGNDKAAGKKNPERAWIILEANRDRIHSMWVGQFTGPADVLHNI